MAISNPLKNQEIHTAGVNTNKPLFSLFTGKKNSIKPSLWNTIRVLKRVDKTSHTLLHEKKQGKSFSPFLACPARIRDLELGANT